MQNFPTKNVQTFNREKELSYGHCYPEKLTDFHGGFFSLQIPLKKKSCVGDMCEFTIFRFEWKM